MYTFDFAVLLYFFTPDNGRWKLHQTQAQIDAFKAEFDLLPEADVKELVAYLAF